MDDGCLPFIELSSLSLLRLSSRSALLLSGHIARHIETCSFFFSVFAFLRMRSLKFGSDNSRVGIAVSRPFIRGNFVEYVVRSAPGSRGAGF